MDADITRILEAILFMIEKLEKKQLIEITGGGFSFGLATLIGAGIVFIIGVIDGFIRPLKCN